jgi:hypothetical protein
MSQFSRWLKLLKLRSARYKSIVFASACLVAFLLIKIIFPLLFDAWNQLATRTPLAKTHLVQISVTANHLSPDDRRLLVDNPHSVAAYRVKPSLKLLGIGQELINEAGEARFVLGILPDVADQVLKNGTKLSLRVEAPSLGLLFQDLIYSQKGQKLRQEIEKSKERSWSMWSEFWPEIKEELKTQVKYMELFSALAEDEFFIKHLKRAFLIEISSRVDLEALSNELSNSQAMSDLLNAGFKNIKLSKVFKETLGGAIQGVKDGGKLVKTRVDKEAADNTLLPDLGYCSLKLTSLMMPNSIARLLGTLLDIENSSICSSGLEGAKGILKSSAKRGGMNLAKQGINSLIQEKEVSKKAAQELFSIANEEVQPITLLQAFWQTLSQDEELKQHLKKKYGVVAYERIKKSLLSMSRSEKFSKRIDVISKELKLIARKGLRVLILDQEGKGPNPLLLSVIQEQLSGQRDPKVFIELGNGNRLGPGHSFIHQDLIR